MKVASTFIVCIVLFLVAVSHLATGDTANRIVGLVLLLISVYSAVLFVYVATLSLIATPVDVTFNTLFYTLTVPWDKIAQIEYSSFASQYTLQLQIPQHVTWRWHFLSPITSYRSHLPLSHFGELKDGDQLTSVLAHYAPHLLRL